MFCAIQRRCITVLASGLVKTVVKHVAALMDLMSVGLRTAAVLTDYVNLVGPIHLPVRPVCAAFLCTSFLYIHCS